MPTSRPTRILLSWRVATCGSSSFMKSATRWVMSNCQSGLSRWLGWPQGPAPSDTNWVRTRTMACWYWRAQPRPRRSSSSSSSLSRVGLMGKERRLLSQGMEFMMLWSCKADTPINCQEIASQAGDSGPHRSTRSFLNNAKKLYGTR